MYKTVSDLKIGDIVTRKSHHNDLRFCIVGFYKKKVILRGEELRLYADADEEDLVLEKKEKIQITLPSLPIQIDSTLIRGKVLHLDGDVHYLRKAMEAYTFYNIKATGYYVKEKDMPFAVKDLLMKDTYDILVLTGHDGMQTNEEDKTNDLTTYRNSYNFVLAVQEARAFFKDKDALVIIAGACQSNYEALIESGANFASSPQRKNIHLLDPIIVAASIASIRVSEYVEVDSILKATISKEMGGIDTRGKARRNFFGGTAKNDFSEGTRQNQFSP